jgi:4-amino-4-deoxy-L-arabinose transferase-like glycosyltransferase
LTAPLAPSPALARRSPAADVAVGVALVVVGVVVPAVLAGAFHVFSIPRNDDWAYRRDLWGFVHTGHLSFVGWGAMSLVGQVLWGAMFALLFGTHAWVPGVAVAVLATAGVLSAYAVARSMLSRGGAAACVLVLFALPGFVLNTSSFMTDVPAFSAGAVGLALALAALRRAGPARWGFLAALVAVGCFGFAVREFDIAAPLAAIAALALQDRRHRAAYALAAAGLLMACAATYLWAAHVPGSEHLQLTLSGPVRFVKGIGLSYFTLSLGLAPLLPAAVRRWQPRLSVPDLLPPAGALTGGVLLLTTNHLLFSGNYLMQQGATGAAVLTGRPVLFPGPVWWALQGLALAAGTTLAVVAGVAARRPPPSGPRSYPRVLLALFALLTALFLCSYQGLVKGTVFDRYLWPLAFALAVLLVARPAPLPAGRHARGSWAQAAGSSPARLGPALRSTSAVLAGVAVAVAVVTTLNADAYDAARWSAGTKAVASGLPAVMVDAGFEWVGSHQAGVAVPGRQVPGTPFYDTWYDQMFPAFRECAFVSGNEVPVPSLGRLATVTYQEFGWAGPQRLYVYVVHQPGC